MSKEIYLLVRIKKLIHYACKINKKIYLLVIITCIDLTKNEK